MEWAQRQKVLTTLPQLNITADDLDDIDAVAYLGDQVVVELHLPSEPKLLWWHRPR